ncbi:MAG: protein-ADP-ribose hydrolase [Candidatus Borkfalkiaceae bacterium]|nr:protein-ADP-ribose hydrolase [Christensenellaceae bacterium]
MIQTERRKYLIEYLLKERNAQAEIPSDEISQKRLLRALFNVRMPKTASGEFKRIQDEYLQEELRLKGVTDIASLAPVATDIYLWKGDITTLKCDGIVNAANSQMLGCFCPNHGCIDNAIHTFAGIGLRQECAEIMKNQGEEPTGRAKITKAYNLPCKYILHTVGPIVYGELTKQHEKQLADCYRSCLTLADKYGLQSLAFCCISTGEFRFPNEKAAEIAVRTVIEYKTQAKSKMKVVFNVFKETDYAIYARILGADK